jgi:DNA-binding NtrC family response regulator
VVPEADMVNQISTEALDINGQLQAKGKLVLIIDDEENIREGLARILELWGYQVITAPDLDSAKLQLDENVERDNCQPDVIISDYRLRENRTGVEAIKAIHEKYNAEIPALLITGDVLQDRLIDMKKSNFQVLFKPVAPMKLRAFLRSVD